MTQRPGDRLTQIKDVLNQDLSRLEDILQADVLTIFGPIWPGLEKIVKEKVTCGTVFHGTKVPLQKWFLAIALIVNAKKSLSSHQLSRDLNLNKKTAWFMQVRIRAEMAKKTNALLLQGLLRQTKPIQNDLLRRILRNSVPFNQPVWN